MILIVTNRADHTADWLILELERRGSAFTRFNTEDFPGSCSLVWHDDGTQELAWGEAVLDLASIDAVCFRRPIPPDPSIWDDDARGRWALGESRATLDGIWRSLDVFWVNHPDHNRAAGSKLEQLRRAREVGFDVPRTLVTNVSEEARAFAAQTRAGLVCKPIDDGQLDLDEGPRLFFTSRFEPEPGDLLDDLGPEPYLFQELVPKCHDVRVTVIGDAVFATRIESQETEAGKTDWRVAGPDAKHVSEGLPEAVAQRCVELTRSYGLHFGAIDLGATADGGYAFFEINPNGQWAWVEQITGQPLRAAMADLLEGRTR
jgi:hypothetical protein